MNLNCTINISIFYKIDLRRNCKRSVSIIEKKNLKNLNYII